jgi:hypothetical protein
MDPQLLIVNNKMHLICPILHLFYAASQQSNPGFRRAAAPRAALHAAAQRRGLLAATERSRVASRRPLTPLFRGVVQYMRPIYSGQEQDVQLDLVRGEQGASQGQRQGYAQAQPRSVERVQGFVEVRSVWLFSSWGY